MLKQGELTFVGATGKDHIMPVLDALQLNLDANNATNGLLILAKMRHLREI